MAAPARVTAIEVKIINSQSCILAWKPVEKGSIPLKGYYIEQQRLDGFDWARINLIVTERPFYLVNGLIPGRRYKFRIITEDFKGWTSQSAETCVIQPLERPHPPLAPIICDVTQRSCLIEWSPPEWDGGTPITQYLIERQSDYYSPWEPVCEVDGSTSAVKIDGLVQNSNYTFQIRAVNKIGRSCPSPVSETVKARGNDVTDENHLASLNDEDLENWGLSCVSKSFSRSIDRISSIVELIQSQSHAISYWAEQKLSKKIKTNAAAAYAYIQNATSQLDCLNKELNRRLETLVRDKGQKEFELREKEKEISKVCTEIKEMKRQLKELEAEKKQTDEDLKRAEDQIRQAEDQLRRQKRKKKKGGVFGAVLTVAVGAFAGPAAGFVVGGLTFAACKNMDDVIRTAREIRDVAEQNRELVRQRLKDKGEEITEAKQELKEREAEKAAINAEIDRLKCHISEMQQRIGKTVTISVNMKQCSLHTSITEGRMELLNDQARFLYQPATILMPLRELTAHLVVPEANRLSHLLSGSKVGLMVKQLGMITEADKKWRKMNLLTHEKDLQVAFGSAYRKHIVETIATIDLEADKIFTQSDALEDAAIILAPTTGWEQLLSSTPMNLAFLGQILLLSLKRDFTLIPGNTHVGAIRLLKHPSSLRASIVQVVNEGWMVFNTAHGNMDQIRASLKTIPQHLARAFDIISTGSDTEVANFLQLPLSTIKMTSENCLQKSRQIETRIMALVNLLAELQETCVLSKSNNEREKKKLVMTLQATKEESALVEEERRLLEARRQEFRETMMEADRQFENTITSLPDGWNIVGMAVVDGITSTVTSALKLLTKPFTKPNAKSVSTSGESTQSTCAEKERKDIKLRAVYKQAAILQNIVEQFVSYIEDSQNSNLVKTATASPVAYIKTQIEFIMDRIKKIEDCPAKKQLSISCVQCVKLCERFQFQHNALVPDSNSVANTKDECISIQTSISNLVEKLKLSVSCVEEGKSTIRKSWTIPDYSDKRLVKYELAKAKSKVEQTCAQLEYAQIRYDEMSKGIHKVNTEHRILLGVLTRMDMESLDVADIIDLLGRGIKMLSEIRQPWGRLVHFFGSMSNLIDSTLNVSLKSLADMASVGERHNIEGYNISHLRRDMIYHQAILAAEISHYLSMIASTYTTVSDTCILPNIRQLLGLLKFDPESQSQELRLHSQKLMTDCESAQQHINDLMLQRNKAFRSRLNCRITRLRELKEQKLAELEKKIQQLPSIEPGDTKDLNPDNFV